MFNSVGADVEGLVLITTVWKLFKKKKKKVYKVCLF